LSGGASVPWRRQFLEAPDHRMIGAETIVILPAGVLRVQIGIANPQFVAAHAVADLLQDSGFSLAEQVVLEINILFNQHFAQSQDHCRVTRGKY
jgi:hypothetical protein